jgi:hypothetical protein
LNPKKKKKEPRKRMKALGRIWVVTDGDAAVLRRACGLQQDSHS